MNGYLYYTFILSITVVESTRNCKVTIPLRHVGTRCIVYLLHRITRVYGIIAYHNIDRTQTVKEIRKAIQMKTISQKKRISRPNSVNVKHGQNPLHNRMLFKGENDVK